MKRIVEFLFETGMLKRSPRTGYQFLGSGGESVADHSFRTAVIAYVLASMEPEVNRERLILMCLFHDLPEARTGDHNYVNKKYVQVDEGKAIRDQVNGLDFAREIISLAEEFNVADTLEARLSKDADQLDLILELKEQSDLGNPHARDWLSFAVKRLLTESGKKLAEEILASEHDSWWFDKKTDWWVNGSQLNRQRP
ncbi:MAG: HD domain-containing protein [Deltaproteobacteria bacterium]|nr:HD domain-containing protein [Deltaproteobacteria bacterium]MBW2048887.1 HD domain-containing protein [Deltaproteobacteria bacterium]MBW2110719.1 HD domain-containing protein [Deltaproteobacteria bacterium]MBW2353527.1 HD domain-containing protein [Deltaproteobacteria bacterium]HDZ91770.1 HD domain-containing protein [Deltaproteobacteria bacterium]